MKFVELGIASKLAERLRTLGVTEPTPIQEQAIPPILTQYDVIGQAQTGTGKTLAFLLPILEQVDVESTHVQALILTPTRELALQITEEMNKLAPVVGASVLAAYGGQDVERQIRKLSGGIQVIIATPGRLLDHLRRGTVSLDKLGMLVLDEADQMLHIGFGQEVEEIIRQTNPQRQTLLFSATMPNEVRALAKRYMKQPLEIHVASQRVTLDEIEQVVIETSDREKQDALCEAVNRYNPFLAIIFCRTKRRASTLNEALQTMGYNSDELHGDLSQAKREQVMKRFRDAKIQLLVATDVAARGLDVEGVTHVFNYDIPHDVESYIHRIGRTGRAGERGIAVTFAAPKDRMFLEMIEKGIKGELTKRSATAGKKNASGEKKEFGRGAGGGRGGRGGRGGQGRDDNRGSGGGRGAQGRNDNRGSGGGRGAQGRDDNRGYGGGRSAQGRDDNRSSGGGRGAQGRDDNRGHGGGRGAQDRDDNRGHGGGRGAQGRDDNRGYGGGRGTQGRDDNRGYGGGRGTQGRDDNRGYGGGRGAQDRDDNRGYGGGRGAQGRDDNRGHGGGRGAQDRDDNRGHGGGRGAQGRDDNRGHGGGRNNQGIDGQRVIPARTQGSSQGPRNGGSGQVQASSGSGRPATKRGRGR